MEKIKNNELINIANIEKETLLILLKWKIYEK